MSKSEAGIRGHMIGMLDAPEEIERSFKRAVTDSGNEIVFSNDPKKAGDNNLLGIYKAITEKSDSEVEADFANARGYGDLKGKVFRIPHMGNIYPQDLKEYLNTFEECIND